GLLVEFDMDLAVQTFSSQSLPCFEATEPRRSQKGAAMDRPRRSRISPLPLAVVALLVFLVAPLMPTFLPAWNTAGESRVALRAEGKKRLTLQEVRELEMKKGIQQQKEDKDSEEKFKYRPGTYVPEEMKTKQEDNPAIFFAPLAFWTLMITGLFVYANVVNSPKANFSLLPPELRGSPPPS
ncbi:unnamed protein product, partial [Symbiodinium microadriaticum]